MWISLFFFLFVIRLTIETDRNGGADCVEGDTIAAISTPIGAQVDPGPAIQASKTVE